VDRQSLQTWLDRYVDAWKTYDPEAIGSLFAEDVTYRYHPYDPDDEAVRGRAALVKDWVEPEGNASSRDAAGSYDAKYEAFAVDGDRAVATGWSTYWTDASRSTLENTFHNVFLMRFDGDGRCVEFTELFMKAPNAAG
jgi:ketosteroid isomerase-like protein